MLYNKQWETKVEEPVKLEPWRQTLLDAANVIRKRGWCQGRFSNHGRVCLLGAVFVAINGRVNQDNISKLFTEVKHRLDNQGYNPGWNDAPSRKKAQVIEALEKVAKT